MNKRFKLYFLIPVLVVSMFISVRRVSAITIADYRKDLAELKAEQSEIENNKKLTQQKINAANNEIARIKKEMNLVAQQQEAIKQQMVKLGLDINEKDEQIKDLVVFKQKSSSENFYLKYIFGAESFTDLIYRVSIIQQLTKANDQLVDEMNNLVEENKTKGVELEKKEHELDNLGKQTLLQVNKLISMNSKYDEEGENIDEQIANMEKQIKFYADQGCGENENLSSCVSGVPYDNGYIKPLKTGVITDNFGYRNIPCVGCSSYHKGIDIGGNREGTPVYSVAAGRVSYIAYKLDCGGNAIIINHIVNGEYITTRYFHLLTMNVKTGDVVAKGQQIGTVGGGAGTASYDGCSTGAHLHFEMVKGHYFGSNPYHSYTSYSTYLNNVFDPRKLIWFPDYGIWF